MRWGQRRKRDADLERELQSDLELEEEEQRERGASAQEAHYAALRAFGNPTAIREQTLEVWSWERLETLLRDLRISIRTLARQPAFSAVAMLVIAVGIGATISLFTVVWSVLLKPLPFEHPEQLVRVFESTHQFSHNVVAPGIYGEWKRDSRSFSSLALYNDFPRYNLSDGGTLPEKVRATICSWDLFSTLGVQPSIGRSFTAADDQPSANGTVILSWGLWNRRFGSDPAILGRKIYLDAKPYTVIGVMPASFAFPEQTTQIFLPVSHERTPEQMAQIANHEFIVIGRLKPGVTREQATQEVSAMVRRIHDAHLDLAFVSTGAGMWRVIDYLVGDLKPALYMLLAATGCMLLIACLNVANLLIARSAARRRELAIRTALGGGRFRLIREQLIETFLLFSVGGATGLALAYMALRWLVITRSDMVRVESIAIDGVVVAAVVGLVLICALFAGLIPVLASRSENLLGVLQESSRGSTSSGSRTRVRKVLVGAEVAFTVVLLVSAGLLLKSYMRLRSNDLGCITDNVLTMHFSLPEVQYSKPAQRVTFFDDLLARVRALPGVNAAGLVRAVPGEGYFGDGDVAIAEHPPLPPGQSLLAIVRWADPGYFASLGIPFLQGRTFGTDQHLDAANQAVVSAEFARQYFPNEDPIGKHLVVSVFGQKQPGRPNYEIVGVVGDTRYELADPPKPTMYFQIDAGTFGGSGEGFGTGLVVRAARDPESLALPIQKIIQQMDRQIAVSDVLTMKQIINQSSLDANFEATLLAAFAGISLLLAAVGLFGVLAYLVTQRRTEIGVRMALGAQRDQVLRLMLSDGMRPALYGLVLGLLASIGAVRLIASLLYGTRPFDPGVFAGVAATLLSFAALACLVPAWKASRVNPMQALRTE